ncbi:penicillin acylase family protein [Planococcus sp. N028]|uniref:Penicillin acylase family protein n=1 Tax=Planococcus shixiaomingii TaxID=3058393 RepID=A0ABT8N6I2_9BACL|nr:penicillin acylase family protein [Planococcus sp. N028]MDN7243338.1 penicillin acylase family protein [Planococcus sp. N028]
MPKKERKESKLKWFLGILGVLLTLAVAALIFVNVFINKSNPEIEGETAVSILENQVTVTRDDIGVPHIKAETDADLYRAQGYVQAQDRMFQMDLSRRQASGRLAEVVGEAAVDTDKFFRTFSLRDAAEKSWDGYDDEAQQVLEWYAEGVNAYIKEAKAEGTLSFEFSLFGYEPEEWSPTDSLTIGKFMAYDLGGNWSTLAIRHWALNEFPEDKARELFIRYPEDAPSIIEANLKQPVKVAGEFDGSVIPPEFNGSNNWVVSGDKTESGKPLLADDPHLGLSTPSIWYQMHLESPEQNVSGVIFAGVPGIILGHNEDIAWGVTNVGPDVQDLYIETPNPEDPHQFKYEGKWEEAEVRSEPIRIKDGKTEEFEVVVTRHGPIISNVLYDEEDPEALFSMQWTALEPTLELQAVLGFNKASDWTEFETALEDFQAPAQNFVFASTDGTIAYKANGRIPIRKKGDGQLPVPGDSADYGWEGYVPFDELPRVVNPENGFIATANNEVVDESYKYHITDFWAQPYRYERIAEVLEASDNLTKEDMMALQMDQKNLYAAEFVDSMISVVRNETEDFDEVLDILEQWDQVDSPEQAAPLIFHKWMKQLPVSLLANEFPEDVFKMLPGKNHITDQMMRDSFAGNEGVWVSEYGGIGKWLTDALAESLAQSEKEFGSDYKDWKWGEDHQLTFPHPLAGASPVFERFLNPAPVPIGGSNITVQAAAFDTEGNVDHGASWRFVADLSDLSSAYHIVGPGQSGHMKSDYFHNQVDDWAEGNYHETAIDGEAKGSTLILSPE